MKKPYLIYLYFFLLAVSILIITIVGVGFRTDSIEINKGETTPFNTGWVLDGTDGTGKTLTLPAEVHSGVRKNEPVILKNNLPGNLPDGMNLCFSTYHSTVQVYVDGKQVYQFGVNNTYGFGKSPGSTAWHFVDLPPNSAGKQVMIKSCSPYDKYAGNFNAVSIGTRSNNIKTVLHSFDLSNLLSGIVLAFGIVLFIGFLILRNTMENSKAVLYQALFIICVSISAFAETSMFFVIPNPLVTEYIMYFSLMLCPIPYLLFVKEAYAGKHQKWYDILCILTAVQFVVCTFLQIVNLVDLPQTIFFTHTLLVVSILLSFFKAHENRVQFRDRKTLPFLWGSALMLVFITVDLARYYLGIYKDGALMCRTGLLLFIALPAIDSFIRICSSVELVMETRVLRRLAYVDMLTKKANRNAFESEIERLSKTNEKQDITLILFDLNNLKQVNDNFGHKQGDEIIIGAADMIDSSFFEFGKCYRIGGDEFIVIFNHGTKDQLNACVERMDLEISRYNATHSNLVQIAYGWADYESGDRTLYDTMSRADEWMYRRKRNMKEMQKTSVSS